MTRVISLGLDGAAWHELDRLIDRGDLPNLARLVQAGARAPLRSVSPPVTCPAWRCSTAGKNPGALGVFWWLNLDRDRGAFTTPDATSFDTADLWDYLSEEGYRSAVLNVPMTYPPRPLDGVMVSGFGAPFETVRTGDTPITYPRSFHETLVDRYDWQVGVDDVTASGGPERALELIRSRFELLEDLLEEGFDYLHLTVFYINVLQHKFGNGPETVAAWRLVDDYVGDLLEADALLVLYSDHGHSTVDRTFSVNRWLADRGYLSFDSGATDAFLGGVYDWLKAAGVSPRRVAGLADGLLPDRVYDTLLASGYPISTQELARRVDWSNSVAVAVSQGPVYLNRQVLGDEYDAVRDRIATALESVTHDGDPVVSRVRDAETVYDGPYVHDGPDLLVEPAPGWELYGGVTTSPVEEDVTSWTSGNHPVGVLAVAGEDVADVELAERSILDVAPTVLQYMGCAVPTDMEGTVLDEAFATDLGPRRTRTPIRGGTDAARSADDDRNGVEDGTESEDGDLRSRLSELGYLE